MILYIKHRWCLNMGTGTLTCLYGLGFVNSDGQAILHTRSQKTTNQLMTMSNTCRLILLSRKFLPLLETPTKNGRAPTTQLIMLKQI